jgi:hypothetical protein
VVAAAWLELAGRWTLPLIALLQAATLASTYVVANAIISGPPTGAVVLAVAAAALVGVIIAGFRGRVDAQS